MMWVIAIALGRGGNKQSSNWVANLRLRHKETWVGLATTSTCGMGEAWFMDWVNHGAAKD
jgi:hypothetical protein